jgi:hypothetical protein
MSHEDNMYSFTKEKEAVIGVDRNDAGLKKL